MHSLMRHTDWNYLFRSEVEWNIGLDTVTRTQLQRPHENWTKDTTELDFYFANLC